MVDDCGIAVQNGQEAMNCDWLTKACLWLQLQALGFRPVGFPHESWVQRFDGGKAVNQLGPRVMEREEREVMGKRKRGDRGHLDPSG